MQQQQQQARTTGKDPSKDMDKPQDNPAATTGKDPPKNTDKPQDNSATTGKDSSQEHDGCLVAELEALVTDLKPEDNSAATTSMAPLKAADKPQDNSGNQAESAAPAKIVETRRKDESGCTRGS